MTKNATHLLVLSSLFVFGLTNANTGSAVAIEPHHGNLTTAYGGPVLREEQRALRHARQLYGKNVKLFAASDVSGYGAVGVAGHGNKALVAAALGRKSAAEAQSIVLSQLVKAGGTNARIITSWHDTSVRIASN
jgi:hypothetical protein